MAAFPASIIFKATDEVSGPMRRMGRSVNRTFRLMSSSVNRLDRQLDKIGGRATGAFGALGLAGGVFAAQRAMRSAIVTGADFEQTLVNAAAKFPEGIKRGTAAFMELEQAAEDVGRTTIFSASQAAQGLNFLAMAGFNAEQSMAALPVVTRLAIASQTELGVATDIASDALGAFGLASEDAEVQAGNLGRIVDVMARTVTSANTDMETLFETIKDGAPVATSAGASIETFSALAGELANAGIKGSRAGTTLKNVFLKLSAPTGTAAKVIKRLGLETQDSEGNLRDVIDILEDLGGELDGLGTAERAGVLEAIFGKIPIAGVNVLLDSGADKLRAYRQKLEEAKGAAEEMALTMSDTVTASFKTLLSSTESAGLALFKLNRESFAGLIERATEWVRTVDTAIRANGALAEQMQGNFVQALTGAAQITGGFIALLIGMKAAVFAVRVGIFAYNTALIAYKGVTIAAMIATKAFRGAMFLLNLAFKASPIGFMITAAKLLAVGAIALIANWSSVKEFFTGLWSGIVDGVKNALSWLDKLTSPITAVTEGVGGLFENFGQIFGGGDASPVTPPGVSSPGARTARSIEERIQTNRTEVTIADQTGRAQLTGPAVPGVSVVDTAAP